MKRCSSCGIPKKTGDFCRDKNRKDGLQCYCRQCTREKGREYYLNNSESCLKRMKAWHEKNPGYVKEHNKEYYKLNGDKIRASTTAYKAANKEKVRAHSIVENAIRYGKIERKGICESCSQDGFNDAHHEDYSEPFDIVWLCKSCHITLHRGI